MNGGATVWALLAISLAASVLGADGISFRTGQQVNYAGNTAISVDAAGTGFTVTCTRTQKVCTAWCISSARQAIPATAHAYALTFDIRADVDWRRPECAGRWTNELRFHDAQGELCAARPLGLEFLKGDFVTFRFCGSVPKGAATLELHLGIDSRPPVLPGESVVVRQVTCSFLSKGEQLPPEIVADLQPPLVRSLFTSPSMDTNLVVRYGFEDASAIDWGCIAVTDAVTRAAIPFARKGDTIVLQPATPWTRGVHRLFVSVRDSCGNAARAHKAFLIGETPKARRVALRDDGIVLLEGRPFYPIGVYGIKPHAFNGNSLDTAIKDLCAAGLNMGHSYRHRWEEEFLTAAARHGMKLWTDGKGALSGAKDEWFLTRGRADPATIAWYIGDDTSMYMTPGELHDRDEACRMLDGTRLTCHADGVAATRVRDNFQDYVKYADVFMPEIYPIDGTRDEACVAEVCRDMARCRADIARYGEPNHPYGLWAILQCFDGKSWRRYPTADEMYAMSFAAVVHGATGMTWFHYAGEIMPDKTRYSGMFRTPADWACMTNITHRVQELAPILVTRTPSQPCAPKVLAGPATDPLGQPSVTMLVKRAEGAVYVIAVNAAKERVRVALQAGTDVAQGEVLWEDRMVVCSDGTFTDDFAPFAVHVYRIHLAENSKTMKSL